jgi:hypothetical protein
MIQQLISEKEGGRLRRNEGRGGEEILLMIEKAGEQRRENEGREKREVLSPTT